MRRREDRSITKHTLNLYAGDYLKLQSLYGSRIGAAKIIRDVIHAHIRKIEEDALQKLEARMAARREGLIEELDVEVESNDAN